MTGEKVTGELKPQDIKTHFTILASFNVIQRLCDQHTVTDSLGNSRSADSIL